VAQQAKPLNPATEIRSTVKLRLSKNHYNISWH